MAVQSSLKQQLLDAGVNLSDMARDIPDENYPNLYEVLRKEERGLPITRDPQIQRLEKLRAYLASALDGTVQSVRVEDQEEAGEIGDQWKIIRAQTRPLPRGLILIKDNIRIKGKLCGPGSIINLTQAHGPLDAGNYILLRVLAKPEDPNTPYEIELYGGPGYLRAKTDPKTGFPRWIAKHRTVRPDCFSRPRLAAPRVQEKEEEEE